MNQREAYDHGVDRGYEAGTDGEFTDEMLSDVDAFQDEAFEIENHSRCFSPFEFFANDINDCGDRADGLWEAYDNGVGVGIRKAWKEGKL